MVNDFKNLEVWKDASRLVNNIYELTEGFPSEEKYTLTSQLRRSIISIASNIAEAAGRYHFNDKINFLFNARGSLEETRSHLIIAEELGYVSSDEQEPIEKKLITLRKKLNGLINAWRKHASE